MRKLIALALAGFFFVSGDSLFANPNPDYLGSVSFHDSESVTQQRRKRPGSIVRTQEDEDRLNKVTIVQARYIRNNSRFTGGAYMVGDNGGIKVGDVSLKFKAGKYYISFNSASVNTRTASTRQQRQKQGISEYAYDHSWKKEKIGDDFAYSGKYVVQKQRNEISLILYNGDTDQVFAKIPLKDANQKFFEFNEDDVLFQFNLVE